MYALVYALFLLNGQSVVDGGVVKSLEECEAIAKKIPENVAKYNADADNPIKIVNYVAACEKLEKAPQGKKA